MCSYNNMTYGHFFIILLHFIPVSIKLTHCSFGVQAALVCGANVPAVILVMVSYIFGGT